MAVEHGAIEADPDKTKRRASGPRIAGCRMIVLDASVVLELLINGPLANSATRSGRAQRFVYRSAPAGRGSFECDTESCSWPTGYVTRAKGSTYAFAEPHVGTAAQLYG